MDFVKVCLEDDMPDSGNKTRFSVEMVNKVCQTGDIRRSLCGATDGLEVMSAPERERCV